MDSQSAGWFFKRTQNTFPHKTHLQTALEPGAAIYQTRPQPVLQTVPGLPQQLSAALKYRSKTSSKDSGRCHTASGLSQWVWDRLQLYWFLQLSNYSILPCIFQGNSVFLHDYAIVLQGDIALTALMILLFSENLDGLTLRDFQTKWS